MLGMKKKKKQQQLCLTHLHSKSIDWFLYEDNTGI